MEGQGFSASIDDLEEYLETIAPPGIRGASKHGKVPWAKDLFAADGRAPTERITVKKESVQRRVKKVNRDDLILDRWRTLAGIKD